MILADSSTALRCSFPFHKMGLVFLLKQLTGFYEIEMSHKYEGGLYIVNSYVNV